MSRYRFSPLWLATAFCGCVFFSATGQGLKDATGETAPGVQRGASLNALISGDPDKALVGSGFESLGLDKRIAQLMVVRLNGQLTPDNFDRQILSQLPPGGVILPSVTSPRNTIDYVKILRAFPIEQELKIPFLIGADVLTRHIEQELGVSESYLRLPSQMAIAAAGMSDSTKVLFDDVASHLHDMGLNFHVGPSLSLSNAIDPSLGTVNTFGDIPQLHADIGNALYNSFQKHGIAWLPLDFPGGARNRSGVGPPVLLTPMSQLREHDLLPYMRVIEGGAELLHVGNILVPSLDASGIPASLSSTVLQQRLREDLGYTGIIVAGPMDGHDLRSNIDPASAAVEALRAGADMLLWESDSPHVLKAIVQIALAVKSGDLDEEIINDRVKRVLELKTKMGLLERALPKDGKANDLEHARAKWESAVEIERRSVTLLRNVGGILPLSEETSIPLGLTGTLPLDHVYDVLHEEIKQIGKQPIKSAKHAGRVETFELERLQRRIKGTRVTVCLFSNDLDAPSQAEIIKVLREGGSRVVAVLFGQPSTLAAYGGADAIVVVYGTLEDSKDPSETVHALTDVLLGRGPLEALPGLRPLRRQAGQAIPFDTLDAIRTPVGRLPVAIPGLYNAGSSVSYRPDTNHMKVYWDFGDGAHSKEHAVEHTYTQPGSYTVTLTVDPKKGATVSGTYEVIVE